MPEGLPAAPRREDRSVREVEIDRKWGRFYGQAHQIQRKRTSKSSEPRVQSPEENSKAKEVENSRYTSVPMGIRLKLFFAQLFLLISPVSTEHSQICVTNANRAMLEQGETCLGGTI